MSDDINRNLTAISDAAERHAPAMPRAGGASDELARMAASLQAMFNRFQVA